jgi:hypothetical protein
MHCEMNITKNFLKTITGKKDTVKVRGDLQRRGIRKYLWLVANPRRDEKMLKPTTLYVLSNCEFEVFARTIESVKMPSGYASNLGKYICSKKYGTLKSHDYHMLIQQLLPLAIQGLLQLTVRTTVMQMCKVYRRICSKVYDPSQFQSLQNDVAESMAMLEMEFPLLSLT